MYDDSGAFVGEITSDFRIALISGKTIYPKDIFNGMITRTYITSRTDYGGIITRTDITSRNDLRLDINLAHRGRVWVKTSHKTLIT